MRKFKVLVVVPLAGIGGTELSTLTLATGLMQAGHQVYVMCNAHPLAHEFTERGIEVVFAKMQRNPLALMRDASIMRRFTAEKKIEIIHFQSAFPMLMSLLSWRSFKASKVRIVWHSRASRRKTYIVLGRLFRSLIDFVIGNCNAERDKLISNGFSPEKVTSIYNPPTIAIPQDIVGKDHELLKELGIDSDTQVVGAASRLDKWRGVKYFIEMAAIVTQEMPDAKFIIAGGGGPLEAILQEQVNRSNLEQQVIFLGLRRDMERVYSIMDVFVNPLLYSYESAGTGNTNAEAMAFAKPVIATDVPGFPEIVRDGITGILVPEKDSERLAQATLCLLRDRDLARMMGSFLLR